MVVNLVSGHNQLFQSQKPLQMDLQGAIGGSIPQAIGASFANPDAIVVCFLGDGTAGFQIADWETARRYKLPIIYIIGNDQRWGAEVEIQIKDYGAEERSIAC